MALSIQDILSLTGGRLANAEALGDRAPAISVSRPASLLGAGPSEISFFFSPEYRDELPSCSAGVLVTAPPFVKPLERSGLSLWRSSAIIVCDDPYFAMALISEKLAPGSSVTHHLEPPRPGQIHSTAVVHPQARIGKNVRIDAYCVIEEGAEIGDESVLYPGCYVGPRAKLGQRCVLFPQVTIYEETRIGDRGRFHAGVRIGGDGFGYAPRRESGQVVGHQKIHHIGRVVIGDDVEIGANTCVDRGTFGDTIIASQVKIDNLVQVGHNARLDTGAIICGGGAIAGGASVGQFAYIGGLTGISNKVHVGHGAKVAACSLISKDVPAGGTASGNPQRDHREYLRANAALNRLIAGKKKGREE